MKNTGTAPNLNDPFWANINAAQQTAACTGKHRFTDAHAARKVADRQRRRSDRAINTYECSHCGGWHLGNQTTTRH